MAKVLKNTKNMDEIQDISFAIETIKNETGVKTSLQSSKSFFQVFTRTTGVSDQGDFGMLFQQLAEDQTDIYYSTDNFLNQIVSTSSNDVGPVKIVGQAIDSNNNFSDLFEQTVTLNGTTPTPIPITLARVHKIENLSSVDLATVYVYEGWTSVTNGVPDNSDAIHLINRNPNSSEISNIAYSGYFTVPYNKYFVLRNAEVGQARGNNMLYCEAEIQSMELNKRFVTRNVLMNGNAARIYNKKNFSLYFKPNETFRFWGQINSVQESTEMFLNFSGYLLDIVE